MSDDEWHIIELYRETPDRLQVKVDNKYRVVKQLSTSQVLHFDHSNIMYLGGEFLCCYFIYLFIL